MFYWMYPAEDFENAPIAIWLNGGPGKSSTFANFLLNGPLRIERNGTTSSDFRVYLNPEGSWVDNATMIYVDQPMNTGFSYGPDYITDMDDAVEMFKLFLNSLWSLYPKFNEKPLYMTGEGYAGKYIPRYSWEILDVNNHLGVEKYNLKASLIGNPYTAPLTQRTHMYIVPEALNILDNSDMDQIATLNRRCQEGAMQTDDYTAQEMEAKCTAIYDYVSQVSGGVLAADNRMFTYDWDPKE